MNQAKPGTSGADSEGPRTQRQGTGTRGDRPAVSDPPLLPEGTTDEQDLVTPTDDDWYERERPPHHG